MSDAESLAPPRLPKPESLEAKFALLRRLPFEKLAKRKHSLVFGFILDWYHSKYGDALASVRHVATMLKERDPAGKGLSVPHVHAALTDLVAWGYLEQELVGGRRAARYIPVWGLVCSVTPVGNTNGDDPNVTPVGNTAVTPGGNAKSSSVHDVGSKDPSTVTRPQDRVNGIDGHDCAAPLAPPAPPAIAADAAGSAQDAQLEPFEQLWRAYDYKKKKREARAAYKKLAPDTALHATMIKAATAWRASWAAQGNSTAPRFRLDKWIEREEYECEPPTAYKPKERKASNDNRASAAKARGGLSEQLRILDVEEIGNPFGDYRIRFVAAGKDGQQALVLRVLDEAGMADDNAVFNKLHNAFGEPRRWLGGRIRLETNGDEIVDVVVEKPGGDRVVEICEAEIVKRDGDDVIVARLVDANNDAEGWLDIVYESPSESMQQSGQERLGRLCRALAMDELADTDELLFKPFLLSARGDILPLPAEEAAA